MRKYIVLYKPFLLFLGKFFVTYIVLAFLYQMFLNSFEDKHMDSITKLVSQNTERLLHLFKADVVLEENNTDGYIKLIYNQKYVARLVEGCNAISVIVLFISFIVSFSGKLKPTVLYILGGSILIYFLNVIRIALLGALLYFFPRRESLLHEIFFPLFIYGVVFVLWVIWVYKFSIYAKNSTKT